ncbi:MAG TPA: hypothetical protein VIU15_38940 [Streptomyces sp.]
MHTYTFVLDQPHREDLDGPRYVVADGDTVEDAEIRARDHLRKTAGAVHGFRRTLIFDGTPLTPPGLDGGTWTDARPQPTS